MKKKIALISLLGIAGPAAAAAPPPADAPKAAPAPAGSKAAPAPAPGGGKAAPAPAGGKAAPAPAGGTGNAPAPAPGGSRAAPAPAGSSKDAPAPAPAGQKAAPAPASAKGAPAPAEANAEVKQVVERMQSFYEKTQGFDTRFEQRFQQGAMPSRLGGASAQGRMRFQKPQGQQGPRMRWDYDDGRMLLLVDDKSYTYDPDTKQVTEYRMDAANLSAAVTFLWGKGKLSEEFRIDRAQRKDLEGAGFPLELTPKKKTGGFSKVFLVVDPGSGMVKRSIVVQGNGSENAITFQEPKLGSAGPAGAYDPARVFPADAVRVRSPH